MCFFFLTMEYGVLMLIQISWTLVPISWISFTSWVGFACGFFMLSRKYNFPSIHSFQYYLKTGTCKFGATCKFHHPKDKAGIAGRVQLNILGYPLRPVCAHCLIYLLCFCLSEEEVLINLCLKLLMLMYEVLPPMHN